MTTAFPRWARFTLVLAVTLSAAGCSKKPDGKVADDTTVSPAVSTTDATVPTIVSIKCVINKINPPELVVDVGGEVPTGGWTDPTLTPREYVTPPADGMYEYDFTAIRPSGPATQVMTPIAASHTRPDYPATTLKGVRVYGIGMGVKEASLSECGAS